MKFFNTAGPINPNKHYYLSGRLNEDELRRLIEQEKYFILHAPRQSGKTTAILQFVKKLNKEGTFQALYVNVEPAQAVRSDYEKGMKIILREMKNWGTEILSQQDPFFSCIKQALKNISGSSLGSFLQDWCRTSTKPIILFIDEIDSLVGDTLISVLRQLRAHYPNRPRSFPQSVCLVGVRNIRDYRIWSDEEQKSILGGSAFNISAESLTIPNFTPKQVSNLYQQHTKETGQVFEKDTIKYAFQQTQGQPWLVNALAYEACFEMVTNRSKPITLNVMQQARERLIKRKDSHLDVIIARLNEQRVHDVISDILLGSSVANNISDDDLEYVIDLGLITKDGTRIANPIYQDVVPQALAHVKQTRLLQKTNWYVNKDGSLDINKLLLAFTQFYRENIEIWLKETIFKEAGPHLLLMAFLQRIINGGGTIHREYALGRGRVDLLVTWHSKKTKLQRIVIELKLYRNAKTLPDGLKQTASYMRTSDATEGHLVIFDRSSDKSWDEKISTDTTVVGKRTINVWRM